MCCTVLYFEVFTCILTGDGHRGRRARPPSCRPHAGPQGDPAVAVPGEGVQRAVRRPAGDHQVVAGAVGVTVLHAAVRERERQRWKEADVTS